MNEQIFTVMEFSGRGDAMFGGTAADWSLYTQEDGSNAFMSAADAQRRQLVKAYFTTKKEANEAGETASHRKGLISALPVRRVDEIPYAQLRWIVGNMHIGTSDDALKADIKGRAKIGHDSESQPSGAGVRLCTGKPPSQSGLGCPFPAVGGEAMKSKNQRRSVEVFDTPSGLGGSHTVEVVEYLGNNKVRVRVWYGRATATGWEAWKDWDGYRFETDRANLTNKRTMPLFK